MIKIIKVPRNNVE